MKNSHHGTSPIYAYRVRVLCRAWSVGRGRVFGRARVCFLTSAILKVSQYGQTCVVLDGIFCCVFACGGQTTHLFEFIK